MALENDFYWLINWHKSQCDGDWEHGNGVKIGTIDNPGWFLKVSLAETELENKKFDVLFIDNSENDWLHCSIKDGVFQGFCGPDNLPQLFKIFRDWVESKI